MRSVDGITSVRFQSLLQFRRIESSGPAKNCILTIAILFVFILFVAPARARQGELFSSRQQAIPWNSAFSFTVDIKAGLVDGDNIPDLIIRAGSSQLLWVRGLGDGTYNTTPVTLPLSVLTFVAVDITGDGKLDLFTYTSTGVVNILTNDGFGNFTICSTFNNGLLSSNLEAGDMDLNGVPDVVLNNPFLNNLAIGFLQPGCSGLQVATQATPPAVTCLTTGDFNADGLADIFLGSNYFYYFGAGIATPGVFAFQQLASICSPPVRATIQDFDHDGIADILAVHNSGHVTFTKSTPSGTFQHPKYFESGNYYSSRSLSYFGDFDNDNNMDVVMGADSNSNCKFLRGTANGNFLAPVNLPTGPKCDAVTAADMNGDNIMDFPFASSLNSISTLTGKAGPSWGPVTLPALKAPVSIHPADFNLDGAVDIATIHEGSMALVWLGNSGGGPPSANAVSLTTASPADAVTVDMNGDQYPDLVTAHAASNQVSLQINSGSGYFHSGSSQSTPPSPSALAAGDFNGDGTPDIVAGTTTSGLLEILNNNGSGALSPGSLTPIFGDAARVVTADLNHDGQLDFVTSVYNSSVNNFIVVSIPIGGGFYTSNVYNTPNIFSVAVEDVNQDGHPDILSARNFFCILFGDGQGNFPYAGACNSLKELVSDMTTADFNYDGLIDAATATDYGLGLHLNTPSQFAPLPVIYSAGMFPGLVAAVDWNLDGRTDIVAASNTDPAYTYNSQIALISNQSLPLTSALYNYGSGTPGCSGILTLGANGAPKISTQPFVLECNNAPPLAPGIVIITDVADASGSDPFGIGAILHVNFPMATEIFSSEFTTSATGNGIVISSIPNIPAIVGNNYFAQMLVIAPPGFDCAGGPFQLASSRGLGITILP